MKRKLSLDQSLDREYAVVGWINEDCDTIKYTKNL